MNLCVLGRDFLAPMDQAADLSATLRSTAGTSFPPGGRVRLDSRGGVLDPGRHRGYSWIPRFAGFPVLHLMRFASHTAPVLHLMRRVPV